MRQIGRTDISGRKTAIPGEEPRLRVQASKSRVVRDLDLDADLREFLEGSNVGGPRIRGRDQANWHPSIAESAKLVHEYPNAAPDDKGAEEVDTVRRLQFLLDRGAKCGLLLRRNEQCVL